MSGDELITALRASGTPESFLRPARLLIKKTPTASPDEVIQALREHTDSWCASRRQLVPHPRVPEPTIIKAEAILNGTYRAPPPIPQLTPMDKELDFGDLENALQEVKNFIVQENERQLEKIRDTIQELLGGAVPTTAE